MTKKFKADELAKKQRAISVAEFFERNRHLLGFDNKRKALMTTIKEAVDNSLDACEEGQILPDINVEIIELGNNQFRIIIEDNGPGIVKKQVPNIFARLLYGSKFHTMKQQRGQQGIGISAAALYGQLTTGKPIKITSRISPEKPAYYAELQINTQINQPEIKKEKELTKWHLNQGTRIELDLEGHYQKGDQSVDTYLRQTAIVNPHAQIIYTNPKAEQIIFPRATKQLPKEAKEIKPHPYGVEIGTLKKMINSTNSRNISSFLQQEFSRVGTGTAKEILQNSGLSASIKPKQMQLAHIEKLIEGIKQTKIISPPLDCISPIGAELIEKGLRKEVPAEFYISISRSPSVYKGIPFLIEVGMAYGGQQTADKTINLMRFANRVPLLYQQRACSTYKSATATNWRLYGLSQSQNNLPIGPLTVVIHIASVWPPFTSEAKEALAHYPEIIKEIKLAIQDCGRKLGAYVRKKKRAKEEQQRVNLFEAYIPEIVNSLSEITGQKEEDFRKYFDKLLEKTKEEIEKVKSMQETDFSEYEEHQKEFGSKKENPTKKEKQTKLK